MFTVMNGRGLLNFATVFTSLFGFPSKAVKSLYEQGLLFIFKRIKLCNHKIATACMLGMPSFCGLIMENMMSILACYQTSVEFSGCGAVWNIK